VSRDAIFMLPALGTVTHPMGSMHVYGFLTQALSEVATIIIRLKVATVFFINDLHTIWWAFYP
jgi:hypothetical protein